MISANQNMSKNVAANIFFKDKGQSKIKISYLGKQIQRMLYCIWFFVPCQASYPALHFVTSQSVAFFLKVRFRTFPTFQYLINIVCILCFKIPALSTQSARKFLCFYRVIETLVFLAFHQSAPVFLKPYFNYYIT